MSKRIDQYPTAESRNNIKLLGVDTTQPSSNATVLLPAELLEGNDGKSIELRVNETYVQWRVTGDTSWTNLIALSMLKGEEGTPGEAATIAIGTITTGVAGSQASVNNSGTATAALLDFTIPKGDKGDKGDRGDKGDTGDKGDKGDTGASVTPLFANSIEECTDTTKLYVLPDGYIYAYLKTMVPGGPAYTNLATAFQEGYRLNSSGTTTAQAGATTCTDYIPFTPGTVVRIKGFGTLLNYNISVYAYTQVISSSAIANAQGGYVSYAYDSSSGIVTLTSDHSASGYLRVSGILSGTTADVIITANEEIENVDPVESYEWKSTGLAFVPADYEDRIIELEEDVLVLKNDVEALSSDSSEDAMIPSYWEPMVADKTATIKALQEAGGKDCVCFAWASDTHIPDNDTGRTTDIGKVMAKMLDNCEIPFAVLTGDIGTRASYPTEAGLIAAQASMPIHLAPLWGTDRLLMALGNHDGCWGDSSGYYRHQFTPERMWQIYFRGQALDFRRVFSDDGMYFYVDNVAQRTRIIVLNSNFGGEYSEDANGWAVNNRFGASCYGQEQLDWLADIALNMPEGYNAIITSHVPPNVTYTVDKAQFIGIVNAYCNKTTYSGSYTAGVDGWTNNNISVDFTNAKGEIIAMFTGHVHGDSIDTTTLACPLITILSAGASANSPYDESAPTRTSGTDTETSFDIVTINKVTKIINCTRVGAGSDREISY